MIEAAWLLIAERGLEGMATREVLARTGAPRGSVYHHFPGGRTELIEAALDHSRLWLRWGVGGVFTYFGGRVGEHIVARGGGALAGAVTGGHEPAILERAGAAF